MAKKGCQNAQNKIFCGRKTFGRHLVFFTSRISASILLAASQSDYRISFIDHSCSDSNTRAKLLRKIFYTQQPYCSRLYSMLVNGSVPRYFDDFPTKRTFFTAAADVLLCIHTSHNYFLILVSRPPLHDFLA